MTLRLHVDGPRAKEWQEFLIAAGYIIPGGADGKFGDATHTETVNFQTDHGLAGDGIVGKATIAAAVKLGYVSTPVEEERGSLPLIVPSTSKAITDADILASAADLQIAPAALHAVTHVEASGHGFLSNGRPKILFEGHVFWRQLLREGIDPIPLAANHRTILYEHWTKEFYKGGSAEYERLEEAAAIHRTAALNAASWGMFQIMGFNHVASGFDTVGAFVTAMAESEARHLAAFGNFLTSTGIIKPLRALDWVGFAKRYNGPGYAANHYDERLQRAYADAVTKGFGG